MWRKSISFYGGKTAEDRPVEEAQMRPDVYFDRQNSWTRPKVNRSAELVLISLSLSVWGMRASVVPFGVFIYF